MEKLHTSKTFLKWLMGGCIPLILPPRSAPGHKLQKPSKESGIFQSLVTINFVLFYRTARSKEGGAWPNFPPLPLNTLLTKMWQISQTNLNSLFNLYVHQLINEMFRLLNCSLL